MSMNTPTGSIAGSVKNIKDFTTLSELDKDQYLLAINNVTQGDGSKIKLQDVLNSSVNEDDTNALIIDVNKKLYVQEKVGDLSNLTTENKSNIVAALNEANAKISSGGVLKGIVATYADLENYGTSTLSDGDLVQVLQDETHDNLTTYYKWDIDNGVFVYVGSAAQVQSYRPNIFDIKWSDHIINDIQWLRADTFSWQSGSVYVTAYNKLVEEYATGTEETEGDITFKRTTNGFKITTADYADAVLEKYNTDGIAWYYILDTANTQFKLPRTKFGFEGLRDNVGDDIAESLPNIEADVIINAPVTSPTGSFTWGATSSTRLGGTQSNSITDIVFEASLSSSTYQDNAPVQERATQMYLYFYVGNYSQTAIEQTAGLDTELFNNKLDLNLANLNDDGKKVIDGQWVASYLRATTSTTLGTFELDLSSYLPDDGYTYEVWCTAYAARTDTSGTNTDVYIHDSFNNVTSIILTCDGSNWNTGLGEGLLVIDTTRKMQYQITDYKPAYFHIDLIKYRRIGTND